MEKKPFVINLKKPEDSPQDIANKLNTLHSAIDVSVVAGALSRDEFEKYKGNTDKVVVGYEDRVNYNIERGTKKLNDLRYHGAGAGLSVVNHDATLSGQGTLASPLSIVAGPGTVTSVGTVAPLSGGTITGAGTISTSMGTNKLIGRGSAGAGVMEEITLGTNLSLSGNTLNSSGGGSGDVVGPSSSTDNAIARFDTTTGKLIQNSVVLVSDSGSITGANSITAAGSITAKTGFITQETGGGTDVIGIIAPSSIAASYTLTLPVDDGNNLEVLQTNGSGVLSWVPQSGGSGSPSAPDTSIQFNDSGSFGGDADFTWNKTTNTLGLNSGLINDLGLLTIQGADGINLGSGSNYIEINDFNGDLLLGGGNIQLFTDSVKHVSIFDGDSGFQAIFDTTILSANRTFTFPDTSGTFVVGVGAADLTAQSAAKTATTLFTPTITGMYRISVYLQVTTAGSISSVLGGGSGVVLTYNDGDGNVAQSDTVALMNTAGGIAVTSATNTTATNLNGTVVINAKAGVAIQYAIGYTSAGTAMQYAAHLRCELI